MSMMKGLEFEPIHRVLFGLKKDLFAELEKTFGANFTYKPVASGRGNGQGCGSLLMVRSRLSVWLEAESNSA